LGIGNSCLAYDDVLEIIGWTPRPGVDVEDLKSAIGDMIAFLPNVSGFVV